jgi:hypothetical protein
VKSRSGSLMSLRLQSCQSWFTAFFRRLVVLTVLSLVVPTLVAGCNASAGSEFNWNFWSRGGMRATVSGSRTGSETKTVRAKEGETLIIDYHIEVERGALVVSVDRPLLAGGSNVWRQQFDHDMKGEARIEIQQSGSYEIWVLQKSFGGRYDIRWDTE